MKNTVGERKLKNYIVPKSVKGERKMKQNKKGEEIELKMRYNLCICCVYDSNIHGRRAR